MRRHVVGLLALILALAACGGPAPTGSTAPPPGTDALVGPVGSPASNDAAAPTATTSTMDGSSSTGDGAADHDPSALLAGWPAAWGSPPVLPTADPFAATGVSDALPGPSLQDPAAIGFALYDPAQMDVGFVSLLARMGIGVDGDDGRVILPGTGDLRLPEGVVRSLIAQGRGDAANLDDQGQTRSTFRDLLPIVGPMVPGWDVGRLAAAYDHAYAAHPDDLLPAVLLGQPIEPSTPLNRLQLWALLVDGFMPPPVAVGAPGAQLAAGGSSFGTANPALPDDPEMAQADVIAMGLDGLIPVTLTPSQASVHEGHRQSGPTVTFTVAVGAARPPSFLPFRPRSTPNLSTTVTWLTGDPAFTSRHGSFSPGLGDAPIQGSSAQLAYRVRREPANGHGPILARTTVIAAEIPVGPLVAGAFDVPAEFQGALPYLPTRPRARCGSPGTDSRGSG